MRTRGAALRWSSRPVRSDQWASAVGPAHSHTLFNNFNIQYRAEYASKERRQDLVLLDARRMSAQTQARAVSLALHSCS